MNQIKTPDDVKKLGMILIVCAHPDDETFLAAGIMVAALHNGQTVACATATRGEEGSHDPQKWPPETIGEVREREMMASLEVLGVKNHCWLDYHDGSCDKIPNAEAAAKIRKLIERYQPDTILTFGPEGMTGHSDHISVSRWTDEAVKQVTKQPKVYHAVNTTEQYERYLKKADEKLNIFFNTDKPPIVEPEECAILFELSPGLRELKCNALKAMPSQTEVMFTLFPPGFLQESFSPEAFVLTA